MSLLFDAVLILLAIVVAVKVVTGRDALTDVIAFITYGIVLTMAWVRLGAVDVALTEVAVGSGATGLVLLRAARSAPAAGRDPAPGRAVRIAAALLSLAVFAGLAAAVLAWPRPQPSLAAAVAEHLPATGLGNPITGVLIVFRALDTLLETVVLLLALVGIWALAPDRSGARAWRGTPAPLSSMTPSGALVLLAQLLVPVGVLAAIYQFWAGASVPAGAFQGGALLGAMWVLLLLARLAPLPQVEQPALALLVLAGPFAFLATGLAGWVWADGFLDYPEGLEKPVIIAVEAAIVVSIGVTLGLLVLGPAAPDGASGRGADPS